MTWWKTSEIEIQPEDIVPASPSLGGSEKDLEAIRKMSEMKQAAALKGMKETLWSDYDV